MSLDDWFLAPTERGNSATEVDRRHGDGTAWTEGNAGRVLVDGAEYFDRLHEVLCECDAGDWVCFTDWQGDPDEQLRGPGTEVGDVLACVAAEGAADHRQLAEGARGPGDVQALAARRDDHLVGAVDAPQAQAVKDHGAVEGGVGCDDQQHCGHLQGKRRAMAGCTSLLYKEGVAVRPLIKAEPALSTYWEQRHRLEEAHRQERRG